MSQHPHRTLWRRDFGVVPAAERRLARFALQWLDSFPAARVALSADDTLVSIWRLTLPLLLIRKELQPTGIRAGKSPTKPVEAAEFPPDQRWTTGICDGIATLRAVS
ncbi:hypothetical protein SAMN05421783_14118 [Thiocapsa roseopersicina]|uniref:Uncharacterized protein n=2 Tax=Thiocapsa roseopersicina TaxID=1058 RepID=A0A1H3D250_THIRO|nr:hypothetical protein SAMN05421783_14118 [Thiocapsa roseopersicina]